jgi:hypothetical protein
MVHVQDHHNFLFPEFMTIPKDLQFCPGNFLINHQNKISSELEWVHKYLLSKYDVNASNLIHFTCFLRIATVHQGIVLHFFFF